MTWKKKLTKKEMKHIKETTNRSTLIEFWKNKQYQDHNGIQCFDCDAIARKLRGEIYEP